MGWPKFNTPVFNTKKSQLMQHFPKHGADMQNFIKLYFLRTYYLYIHICRIIWIIYLLLCTDKKNKVLLNWFWIRTMWVDVHICRKSWFYFSLREIPFLFMCKNVYFTGCFQGQSQIWTQSLQVSTQFTGLN